MQFRQRMQSPSSGRRSRSNSRSNSDDSDDRNSNSNRNNIQLHTSTTHRYIISLVVLVAVGVVALYMANLNAVRKASGTMSSSSSLSSSSPSLAPGFRNRNRNRHHRPVRFEALPVPEPGYQNHVLKYIAVYAYVYEGDETDKDTDAVPTMVSMADGIRILRSSSSWSPSSSEDANKSSHEPMAHALTEILRNAPFPAFRFETPAVTPETISRQNFEFVLVRDDHLAEFAKTPNPIPFAHQIALCNNNNNNNNNKDADPDTPPGTKLPGGGCKFENLRGDATLLAPIDWSSRPEAKQKQSVGPSSSSSSSSCYGHLANFVRGAPDEQITDLWRMVAKALEEKLMGHDDDDDDDDVHRIPLDQPLWWSTAGTGVAWLHFRLDSRPKYYHYPPYKTFVRPPLDQNRLLGM